MRVDEPWQQRPPAELDHPRPRPGEGADGSITAHAKDPASADSDCLRDLVPGIDRVDPTRKED
jgi:hypothetical protein